MAGTGTPAGAVGRLQVVEVAGRSTRLGVVDTNNSVELVGQSTLQWGADSRPQEAEAQGIPVEEVDRCRHLVVVALGIVVVVADMLVSPPV